MILFYLLKCMHFLNILYIQFLNITTAFDFAIKIYHKYVEIMWLKNVLDYSLMNLVSNL